MNILRPAIFQCMFIALGLGCDQPKQRLSDHARKVLAEKFSGDTAATLVEWQDSSYSRYTQLREAAVLENHTYLDAGTSFGAGGGKRIISQHIEWILGPWELREPLLQATAILVSDEGSPRKVWSISEPADEGACRWQNDFYRTTQLGCCSDCDIIRLHNLNSGKLVLTYTHNLLEFGVDNPNNPRSDLSRYIGAIEPWHSEVTFPETDSMALAMISYASEDSCLHTIVLRARTTFGRLHSDTCGDGHCYITMENADTSLAKGAVSKGDWFTTALTTNRNAIGVKECIEIRFQCNEPVFVIPLKGDDFLLERAVFDDYEFIRVK